jgi:hypothetical protein
MDMKGVAGFMKSTDKFTDKAEVYVMVYQLYISLHD